MELRPYQSGLVERLVDRVRGGVRRIIAQLPTGAGKTVLAAELIRRSAAGKGKRVLFLAPRRELVYQCVDKLSRFGVRAGIIMAGEMPEDALVQVATVPTLHARAVRRQAIELPPADFVVWDEVHLSLAPTYAGLMARYPDAVHLGLTATPARSDGRGLGELWQEIVSGPTVAELVAAGALVPQRYFAPSKPDLAGVKIARGDYVEGQLEARMNTPKLVGDVVTNWLRLGEGRPTVVFASGVRHSIHLRDQFRAVGIVAEHLDGNTPADERADILRRLERGDVTVLCNCFVLTFGWDCPPVSCAVIARPTKSLVLYLQMAGRVLRPAPGKTDALLIDHAGIVDEHGFLDEEFPWSLDGAERIRERIAASPKKAKPVTCPGCQFVFRYAAACPRCGWAPPARKGDSVAIVDGDLHEIGRNGRRRVEAWTMDRKTLFYGELRTLARRRGYKEGWAAHKYREKLGVWPSGVNGPLAEPTAETLAWIKSRQIAWARSKKWSE